MIDKRHYEGTHASAARINHPDHIALLNHWNSIKPTDGLPSRSDFSPTDFKSLLPRIAIIEVCEVEGSQTFRYRLAGTEIATRAGRDPTGKVFEELYAGEYLTTAKKTYEDIARNQEPHFSQRVFPIGNGESELRYDRLILPFSDKDQVVTSFLLCIVIVSQPEKFVLQGSFKKYT